MQRPLGLLVLLARLACADEADDEFTVVDDSRITSDAAYDHADEKQTFISVRSKHIFFSEHNWDIESTRAVAVNPGAYFKLNFTNSSRVSLLLQPTSYAGEYMHIACSIDGAGFLIRGIRGSSRSVQLTSHLSKTKNHSLVVYIYSSMQKMGGANRWKQPPNVGLYLQGVMLDEGGSASMPSLRPKRAIFFGDSITEGVGADCQKKLEGGDLHSNAATKSWAPRVASALNAEYSQVGFGSQGWTVPGAGNVPPFFTPDDATRSTWNKIYADIPRKFNNLDYVFVMHGTNDGLWHKDTRDVMPAVIAWLYAIRAAVGVDTAVFVVVPFGQFGATQPPIGALPAAYRRYISKTADYRTFLIDLGVEASRGVSHWGATQQSCDGIHPQAHAHSIFQALVAQQAARHLSKQQIALLSRNEDWFMPRKPKENLISSSSSTIYFSEKNWHITNGLAVAVNPGSYMKINFTNSSALSLSLKPTPYSNEYMRIAFSLDGGDLQLHTIKGYTRFARLVYGLSTTQYHSLVVYIYSSMQKMGGANRWIDRPNVGLYVKGIVLDEGGRTSHHVLRPKRAIFFGDSITEGVGADCQAKPEGGDLYSNAATKSWAPQVASLLKAEYSQVGFGSQGWTVPGAGGVPPFFTPAEDERSAWNKIYADVPRRFDNLDYVFVLHGTNDGLWHRPKTVVVPAVVGWLHAVRAAVGADTAIFLVVPFGQFGATQAPVGALPTAYHQYIAKTADPRTFFIDLGTSAASGVSHWGPTSKSCDGIHPRASAHKVFQQLVHQNAIRYLTGEQVSSLSYDVESDMDVRRPGSSGDIVAMDEYTLAPADTSQVPVIAVSALCVGFFGVLAISLRKPSLAVDDADSRSGSEEDVEESLLLRT